MLLRDRKAGGMLRCRVFIALIPMVCVILLFASCGKDPIRDDLINYLDVQLPKIISLEAAAGNDFTNVTGDQYKGDAIMLKALQEKIIPEYNKFLSGLKKIKPETDEVQEIHIKYIEGATEINNGFIFLAQGLREKNQDVVVRGNFMVDDGASKIREVNRLIGLLAKKHEIAIDTVVPVN